MLTEGRVRAIAAQVASAIMSKIKPSVSEEQIRSDVEAVIRHMQENGELTGSNLTDEQIAAVQKYAESAQTAATAALDSASDAENSKDSAVTSENNAAKSASDAAGSATEASQSATAAGDAKTAAESAAARAEEAANRLLGVAVVGVIETVNGAPAVVLTGVQEVADYTAYFKVIDEDGNKTLVEIGPMVPKDETEKDYTVTFVADGATVAEIGYNIGDAIEEPAVPAKSGYNMGIWEDYDLSAGGNITVNAKYLNNLLIDAGYESGKRLQVNNGATKTETNACVSGYIPVANLAKYFYLYKITLSSAESVNNVIFYRDATGSDDASTILDDKYVMVKGIAGVANAFNSSVKAGEGYYYLKANSWSGTENAKYFRFSCASITDESIVTYDNQL